MDTDWDKIARETLDALAASQLSGVVGERDRLREALTAFADEYLPSGIRETPEWQAVLEAAGEQQ